MFFHTTIAFNPYATNVLISNVFITCFMYFYFFHEMRSMRESNYMYMQMAGGAWVDRHNVIVILIVMMHSYHDMNRLKWIYI